jgi:predicted nucleotidyltransferase
MRRDEVLRRLREHRAEVERFGVSRLGVFGSVARDEAREDSDIDVLVEFSQPVGLFEFLRLDFYLEELLGRRVDLVTPDALRAKLRERILREAIYAT